MTAILDARPKEICVLRLSAVGDTCHAVPVVRTLQAAFPNAGIVWIIGKAEHSLLEGLDGVEFVVFDKSLGWGAYAKVRRELRERRFDVLLDMHASMRANIVATFVAAPLKIGFDRARARDYQWLFCNRQIRAVREQHVLDGMFEFATALGVEHRVLRWDIPIGNADDAFAAQHASGEPLMILSPCSGQRLRNYRNWSAERYAAIADYAAERHGAKVVLTGGTTPIEREYSARIRAQATAPLTDLIGRTTLKQLLALLRRATLLVCPDSGPAHMATAVGTPVIGLYATSNRFRTGPYLSQDLVVDKYPEAVRREFGRSVDELRWGQRVRDPDAMNLISVTEVTEKIDRVFAARGADAAS